MVTQPDSNFDTQNFYSLIKEKAKNFVGRKWVFNKIDDWLNDESKNRPKYFIVTGKAGFGKSAIAAELIKISNGAIKKVEENDAININSEFKNIKDNFLNAFYVISFGDDLSKDANTLSKSLAAQLLSKEHEIKDHIFNSIKTSITNYNFNNVNTLEYNDAHNIIGGIYNITINGSPSAVSVFNDMLRIPLESFLNMNPQRKMVFLIDGLDESITSSKDENHSDSIISILSNLDALENVFFILTTRDYPNILNKFMNNSIIFDISSDMYIEYIYKDVLSFIELNLVMNNNQVEVNENLIEHLIKKVEGNFLYIKFVMDAILGGKIAFSVREINSMPPGLSGIFNLFFDRMKRQYGEDTWNNKYISILRTLLVSFEGLDANQIAFFTGLERQILKNISISESVHRC